MTTSPSDETKIMVTGGRHYVNEIVVQQVMDSHLPKKGRLVILHGDADGADVLVKAWIAAKQKEGRDVVGKEFKALWRKYNIAAGPIRNKAMVAEGPSVCIAFPGNRGTANAKKLAREAGIPVVEIK